MNNRLSNSEQKRKRGRPRNEQRHEEIIACAAKLFMAHGLHATTMEDIARDLGISKLTLYSRFESKDALFAAVIEHKCRQYIPDALFVDFDQYPLETALYNIAYSLMQLITSDDARNMERMLMADAKDKEALVARFYQSGPARVKAMIASHLQRLHEERKLHVPDPLLSTTIFCALVKGSDIVFRMAMHLPPEPTPEEMQSYCHSAIAGFIRMHQ